MPELSGQRIMLGFLKPSSTLSDQDVQRTLRLMRWDSVAASALFSLGSGGFMAAYAQALRLSRR